MNKVIQDLVDIFQCGKFKEKQTFQENGVFHIHKSDYTRNQVIDKLEAYFLENPNTGCAADLSAFTFIHTRFKIIDL